MAYLQLSSDAAYVHSHRGNRKLSLLFPTVQLEAFDALSRVKLMLPTNPGQHPTMLVPTTGI